MSILPKVAITGGSGFLGQHLIAELSGRGIDLTATYKTRFPKDSGGARWIHLDLDSAADDVFAALNGPDILIHLAWSELSNYRSPVHLEQELPRQLRILKSLVDSGLRNLVIAGTCFEYGLQEGELREIDDTAPHLPYPQAKDYLRQEMQDYCQAKDVNFTWLRLFYLFGEGQPERTLYSQFCKAVQDGQKTFNMSPGDQERDYLQVQPAAAIIGDLALQRRDLGVVNICSGAPLTVRSLVEGWRKEMGVSISLNLGHFPYADWEPMSFWGSPKKLQSLLARE